MIHILLKPGLENFEHYFTSMWDECSCTAVWTFFGIAFLWDWNEDWPFSVLWPLQTFPICWHIECSTFTASSFRIWNSSTGIPSFYLRWQRNRTGRPLYPPQIHQRVIWMLSSFHKTISEHWQRTLGTQKGSPLSLKGGRTKCKRQKERQKS